MAKIRAYRDVGIKDFYKDYLIYNKNPIDYKIYYKFVEDVFLGIKERLLDADTVELPYCLGELQVVKYKRKFTGTIKVDWGRTRRTGVRVVYEDNNVYHIHWRKEGRLIKRIKRYQIKTCGAFNDSLCSKIRGGQDYYTK